MKKAITLYLGFWVLICVNFITVGISSAANITSSDPENGAGNVPVETWITVRFNTSMDTDTVNVEINPGLAPYGFRIEWSNDDSELIIKPNADLMYSWNYTILIEEAVDVDGNPLDGPTTIYFETESEQERIAGSSFESPRNIILAIFFLVFGLIFLFLMGFYLTRRKFKFR